MNQRLKDAFDQKLLAEELELVQKEGSQIVIIEAYKNVLSPHFYLFYGNLRFPVVICAVHHLPVLDLTSPAIGICAKDDFPAVQTKYPGVSVQSVHGRFVRWLRSPPE